MKPIQLNEQQIEAILNGASMLCMPIDDDRNQNLHYHGVFLRNFWFSDNKDNAPLDLANGYKIGICIEPPLQIGEQYYVQEDFLENMTFVEFIKDRTKLFFNPLYNISRLFKKQIKFKVTDIQIKRVQELESSEINKIRNPISSSYEMFKIWHNKQYPNQPYEDNPYVFLPKLERI